MLNAIQHNMSPEEYPALEQQSDLKHEFFSHSQVLLVTSFPSATWECSLDRAAVCTNKNRNKGTQSLPTL